MVPAALRHRALVGALCAGLPTPHLPLEVALFQLERDVNYLILLLLLLQGSAASDFTALAVQLVQTGDRTETPALGAGAGTARRFS
jgi:hypothetical protein